MFGLVLGGRGSFWEEEGAEGMGMDWMFRCCYGELGENGSGGEKGRNRRLK